MKKGKIELLAPAGDIESLYAAVQSGADAVYLGGDKFSARAYASNFDEDTMKQAVNYCHLYNVKIYVTVNILIKEDETKSLINYIDFLYNIGVDALIVQDMCILNLIKNKYHDFEVHISTQATIHNGEGAKFLKNSGADRIVLSRETNLKEIEYISKDLNIQTEVFVHGALCICYSGQCLMSSLIGGRSGNRGRCAQPCRLPYTLIDRKSNVQIKKYVLSPKDICSLSYLKKLINTGTSSLKIEGRMKRPEYVAGVVGIYRKAIDSIYENKDLDDNYINNEIKKLKQLFNREGFSNGYMFKNTGKDMMAYNCPKNTGILLSNEIKNKTIKLKENLKIGDGIKNANSGFKVSKIILNGKSVEKAYTGDAVKIYPLNYKNGDILFKTCDIDFLSQLEKYYKNKYLKRINLPLNIDFKVERKIKLETEFLGNKICVEGEVVQKSIKKPLTKERIIENMCKTKDTPFDFCTIKFLNYEEGFLPISELNNIRRMLIDKLYECVTKSYKRKSNNLTSNVENSISLNNNNLNLKSLICVNKLEQLKAALDLNFEDICVNTFLRQSDINLSEYSQKFYLKVPNILKENEFSKVCSYIDKNLDNIKGILTSNLGIVNKFKDKTSIIGDYKLNIFNSNALKFYNNFFDLCCLSVELNKDEISKVTKNQKLKCQYLIYGKIELMVSEYCPIGSLIGGKSINKNCNRDCESGDFYLKDRMNVDFKIFTDIFCRSYLYNSATLNLIPNLDEFYKINIDNFRLDFTDEDYETTFNVLNNFKSQKWNDKFDGYTRGHFKRGVM